MALHKSVYYYYYSGLQQSTNGTNGWTHTETQKSHPSNGLPSRATCCLIPSTLLTNSLYSRCCKKGKGSPYSTTERRVQEPIPVLGSQPAGDVSHKPGGRLPLFSARPAVTLATLKRAATTLAAWWTEARWVWAVCLLRLIPDSVVTAIWTRALLHLSPAR